MFILRECRSPETWAPAPGLGPLPSAAAPWPAGPPPGPHVAPGCPAPVSAGAVTERWTSFLASSKQNRTGGTKCWVTATTQMVQLEGLPFPRELLLFQTLWWKVSQNVGLQADWHLDGKWWPVFTHWEVWAQPHPWIHLPSVNYRTGTDFIIT